ncbi:CPBP family intramembrane glutamic endopeptidase [Granulicoccus phenolivorans]|uniref:CPBP family intramembrane glutamic endopeptidase n=1 Tax=Granulicoccus phenolivorans TaxID=266854 RepID=UPI0004068C4D|nr:CPBP family intramembrane glutamic endopeptidase [Granulicoccus phenolivorans]
MRIPQRLVGTPDETTPQRPGGAATRNRLATWDTKHPWLWAIALAFGGTLLTAFGVGFTQTRQLDQPAATYTQAGFVALSALVGLLIMWRTRPTLAQYGFRRPRELDRTLWLLPLAVIPVILVATTGLRVTPAQALAYLALAVAVGTNEEIWFRGLQLAALRGLGERPAIIGGSALFGAMHLTNFFAGSPPLHLGLQFAFACLVGLVLAEIVAITGSLWIGIAWHLVYDLVAWSAVDTYAPTALAGLAVMTVVLAGYAVWLWRRLPAPARPA